MNEQFLSRNQHELAKLITCMREIQSLHNYGLFLSKDEWELIDLEFGMTIFRRRFIQVNSLIEDIRHLRQSIIECGCIKFRGENRITQKQSWSLRHLQKLYPEHYNFFIYGKV